MRDDHVEHSVAEQARLRALVKAGRHTPAAASSTRRVVSGRDSAASAEHRERPPRQPASRATSLRGPREIVTLPWAQWILLYRFTIIKRHAREKLFESPMPVSTLPAPRTGSLSGAIPTSVLLNSGGSGCPAAAKGLRQRSRRTFRETARAEARVYGLRGLSDVRGLSAPRRRLGLRRDRTPRTVYLRRLGQRGMPAWLRASPRSRLRCVKRVSSGRWTGVRRANPTAGRAEAHPRRHVIMVQV